MGKDVAEPAAPALPDDYDIESEEPTDDDVDETAEAAA